MFTTQAHAKGIKITARTVKELNTSNKGVPKSLNYEKAILPILSGDQQRFQLVVINLVSNAIKFTKSGQIEIKAAYHTHDNLLIVHVRDTGQGIAEKDMSKLFKE